LVGEKATKEKKQEEESEGKRSVKRCQMLLAFNI